MKTNPVNYSKELENMIAADREQGRIPSLLLQVCCAPCSSYCLEYLREDFRITVLYYNPNISEPEEFEKRRAEEKRLIREYNRQVEEQDFDGMHSTKRAQKIDNVRMKVTSMKELFRGWRMSRRAENDVRFALP